MAAIVAGMVRTNVTVEFNTVLLRPAAPADAEWCFIVLPKAASDRLPTRAMVSVDGTLAGHPFQATLEPDGQGGHWLKVTAGLCGAAGVAPGDSVAFAMMPVVEEPEPVLPDDLRDALADVPAARATWDDITAVARRDWIFWIGSGRKAETRIKRIATACDMLAKGKRRACCFDRSGLYSKAFSAPVAAE